ncbi:alpha/beta hydrolase [Cyanobium sp. HWJ4-Hawea]|uniref:alpha/beta hydrolase n=1 Tax=Cyanobium sp. HWJ4-Hawea TaxID=2823713 RepID=UPI0020CEBD2F|nr:alpha/beta hydrolase [Cyanobium sp. HWJ4-Hawea]
MLSLADLGLLIQLALAFVLLLIPTAGIYSLFTQFAFWEGWLQGLPQPVDLFAGGSSNDCLDVPSVKPRRYVIYLDGIHQVEREHPPRISDFLQDLEQRLPADTRLLRGLETYTVMPVALIDEAGSAWFWRRVFALQEHHRNWLVQLICAVLVQGNNVIKVGISSDRRYGPILNYELSLKIAMRLAEIGYSPGVEIVLLGYSGGAEMAMGVADYLRRICRAPIRIVSCCGVFSGNQILNNVDQIHMIVGTRDPVAALGQVAYPGRSPLLPLSNWNKVCLQGLVEQSLIPGMSHNGSTGPFALVNREQVIGAIVGSFIDTGNLVPASSAGSFP